MKKFVLLILALALTLSSFACVYADEAPLPIEQEDTIQSKVLLTINQDGSGCYIIKNYVDDDTYELYKEQIDIANAQSAETGVEYKLVEEGSKKYLEMTTILYAGDPITIMGGSSQNGRFAVNKNLFSTEYFATGNVDSRASMVETPVEESVVYAQITVELPFPATYNNADLAEKFNTRLTWNVYDGRINPIEIKYSTPNYISLAVLALIIVLVVIFVLLQFKKKNLTEAELVENALHHLEGETDEYVEDPFADMTEEEIEADITDEAETIEEQIEDFVEEVVEEVQEEKTEEE